METVSIVGLIFFAGGIVVACMAAAAALNNLRAFLVFCLLLLGLSVALVKAKGRLPKDCLERVQP